MLAATEVQWPAEELLLGVSHRRQMSDGKARCIRVALCDSEGQPARRFTYGETAHLFFEFDVAENIGVPAGGAELTTPDGVVVHGKAAYQFRPEDPKPVPAGSRLRFHQTFELRLQPARYLVNVGLASVPPQVYHNYLTGAIGYAEFAAQVNDHCRLPEAVEFDLVLGPEGWLPHHGLVDLPGGMVVEAVVCGQRVHACLETDAASTPAPTVFHITHPKAGSQWIHNILRECFPDLIVDPQLGDAQVRHYAIRKGGVYPTVYLPKEEFDALALPEGSKWFVVIRDLRDTLISAYFSFKFSHPLLSPEFVALRQKLHELDKEAGLFYLMDRELPRYARIQLSWLEAGEPLVKYEDLLANDVELLTEILIGRCGLPISPQRLREVVLANRFEAQTGGRPRGVEDVTAHQRKGVAGDWRNHFTDRIKRAFKARYGGLLVATGYEKDLDW
jgi:lipopolysaccharide transport system ATP-binding protein